eukprot:COSAG01_NODE_9034_length_2575_cov_3.615105_3_plen_311_part_00
MSGGCSGGRGCRLACPSGGAPLPSAACPLCAREATREGLAAVSRALCPPCPPLASCPPGAGAARRPTPLDMMIQASVAFPTPYCNIIEAPWLVNGGHGASLRHHKRHPRTVGGAFPGSSPAPSRTRPAPGRRMMIARARRRSQPRRSHHHRAARSAAPPVHARACSSAHSKASRYPRACSGAHSKASRYPRVERLPRGPASHRPRRRRLRVGGGGGIACGGAGRRGGAPPGCARALRRTVTLAAPSLGSHRCCAPPRCLPRMAQRQRPGPPPPSASAWAGPPRCWGCCPLLRAGRAAVSPAQCVPADRQR